MLPLAGAVERSETEGGLCRYGGTLMPPSTELIALFRSKGYAAAVSGAGPCVLVLHYGNAREDIDQIASEQLASGHWRVLHLPINTAGVEIERR